MTKNMKMIQIDKIDVGEFEIRHEYNMEDMEELKRSIHDLGLLQPILLRSKGDRYEVVAGNRRYKASKEIGETEIMAIIMDSGGAKTWSATMAENMVRSDLTPVEQATAIKDMYIETELGLVEIAQLMNRSKSWVEAQIEICSWPNDVLKVVHEGKLSLAAAKNLAKIGEDRAREHLIGYAVENGATARITAAWLQAYQAGTETERIDQVEPKESIGPATQIVPHSPCCICGEIIKMIDLSYLPICANCNNEVISAVKRGVQEKSRGGR